MPAPPGLHDVICKLYAEKNMLNITEASLLFFYNKRSNLIVFYSQTETSIPSFANKALGRIF